MQWLLLSLIKVGHTSTVDLCEYHCIVGASGWKTSADPKHTFNDADTTTLSESSSSFLPPSLPISPSLFPLASHLTGYCLLSPPLQLKTMLMM